MKKLNKEKVKKDMKEEIKKARKGAEKEVGEFKKFISKGNVIDMAVGVIIGGAFSKIVTSLVNDIITPLIGIIIGGLDFSDLKLQIGEAKIAYGSFIQTVIDFLIIAFCIFYAIKLFERIKNKGKRKTEEVQEVPVKSDDVKILEEIRDLLKENKAIEKEEATIASENEL